MAEELCLFCNEPERVSIKPNGKEYHYKPREEFDFICSRCVFLLCRADQDDLKKAHTKAIDKGYGSKVKALESFILMEDTNGKRPKTKHGRDINRKRIARPVRN